MSRKLKISLLIGLVGVLAIAQQPQVPVQSGGASLTASQGATAPNGQLSVGGTYNTSLPTLTNGQASQLQLDASGRLYVNIGSPATLSIAGIPTTSSTNATTLYHGTSSTSTYINIKGSAGNVYGFVAFNPNLTPCYLQFYNNATPTVGTSVIDSYGVQAGTQLPIPVGLIALENFATAISYATTTTDSGGTECTIAMSVSVYYK